MLGVLSDAGGYLANNWVMSFAIPVGCVLILVGIVIGIALIVTFRSRVLQTSAALSNRP